jgi:hypothetical protein
VEKPKRGRPKGGGKKRPAESKVASKDENGGDEKEGKEDEKDNGGHDKDADENGDEAAEKAPRSPRKRKEAKPSEAPGTGREKRARKSAEAFAPENFKDQPPRGVTVQKGRGTRLSGIATVKASIDKHSIEDIVTAHKFVFPARGKPNRKECKNNLLAFSGYLPAFVEGEDKKKRDAEDEALEVNERMSVILLS